MKRYKTNSIKKKNKKKRGALPDPTKRLMSTITDNTGRRYHPSHVHNVMRTMTYQTDDVMNSYANMFQRYNNRNF